jgi:hypothetical protein
VESTGWIRNLWQKFLDLKENNSWNKGDKIICVFTSLSKLTREYRTPNTFQHDLKSFKEDYVWYNDLNSY